MSKLSIFYLSILLILTGCSAEGTRKLPGVYRIDIQQGNVIEQEMLDKLRPGMVKDQVHFIMGTPTIVDPFRVDRWEYIYTFSKGGNRRQQRHITIFFEEDKLAYLEGGVVKGIRKPPEEYRKERKTVDVPPRRKKKGFMSKLANVLPFVGDDEPKRAKAKVKEKAEEELSENDVETSPPELESDGSATEEKAEAPVAVEKRRKVSSVSW
jgi:outer membrane protein assembly factor BamE